ncbi:type II secretion system protein GspF [Desulfonema ishimotonii]|uniref:Type II secretion system protein GspF n=1 Tax=Desulfonema ishimotonii TaxID=45657 RepID=A0A401FT84_9BACT|nr:type II secretion system F family protein [Desulfonema ishimotonii]GBC60187.1 type II secretion system protein GspF [Desulfonema ishimotonii]
MTVFSYKASDFSGKVVKGTLEAGGEKDAVGKLQEMGYIPIRVTASGAKQGISDADVSGGLTSLFSRVATKDVMLFTQDLSALLEAGLPIDRALTILLDVIEKDRFRGIVRDILRSVQSGAYLSDAMAQHPNAFSDFYVNMVRAGEAGGVLENVLDRLGIFLETSQELKEYITSALIYPIFLVCVGGASIIILMTFVIPKFSMIFSDLGASIPASTQILLGFSGALRDYWWVFLLTGSGLLLFYRWYAGTPAGRQRIDRYKLRLPVAGDLIRKVEVARFARTLGTLVKSGVPILQALKLVREIIGNTLIAGEMARVYERVKEGDRLSRPLEETGIFPGLAVQMITVGEESGRLDEMLLRVADNYEKVVRNLIKRFVSILEPAMILIMGLVIGFIVISMLMAIFSMNDMPF